MKYEILFIHAENGGSAPSDTPIEIYSFEGELQRKLNRAFSLSQALRRDLLEF